MLPRWLLPIGLVAGWEVGWWAHRVRERRAQYDLALAHARGIGKPLMVVGAPDLGFTHGPGSGDLVVDIRKSDCPNSIVADVCKRLPIRDNSVVAFVSCVLEYVDDVDAARRELARVARDRVYLVKVPSWTLAGHLYPGAKRVLV